MSRPLFLFTFFFISTLFFSCNKYEEGPKFTLRTKINRLTGNWNFISKNENQNKLDFQYGEIDFYYYPCGTDTTIFETFETRSDIHWEFESDYELKDKYFADIDKLNYGQSYGSACELVYDNVESTTKVDVYVWAFSEDKTTIRLEKGSDITEYEIVKLTNEALILENDFGDRFVFEKE